MPMDLSMKYVNHRGEKIDLGDGGSLHYFANTIKDWEWSVNKINGGVSSFTQTLTTKKLPIGIAADSEEEGLLLRDKLYEIAEVDILAKQLGKLWVGDWYMEMFLYACSFDNFHMDERFAEMAFSAVIPSPVWIKEVEKLYYVESSAFSSEEYLDYPYDYPYDYKRPRQSKTITNDSLADCDWLIRIKGPATNPYVNINGNVHQVNVTIPEGSRLEIDSRRNYRTIKLIDAYGNVTNAYNNRNKGTVDSGEYLWKQIPVGASSLTWDNSFEFGITMYQERRTPPWNR